MYRVIVFIVCVFILVFASIVHADFPAEETWRIELDTAATVLGPYWQDEDGQTFFLVGTRSQVLIISEEEIVWESPELSGYVSALNHVDFGVGDGQEIIAATVDADSGRIYIFSGDDYDEHIEYAMFGEWGNIDPTWGGEMANDKYIRTIKVFETMLPDSNKVVFTGNRGIYADGGYGGDRNYYESGRIDKYSLRNSHSLDSITIGTVIDSKIFNLNNDEEILIAGTQQFGESWADRPPSRSSFSRCSISLLNNDLDVIASTNLAGYRHDLWEADNLARYYSLQTLNHEDGESLLFASYRDSTGFHLAKLTIPELEIIKCIPIERIAYNLQIFDLQDDNGCQYLICFCTGNWIGIVDIEEFVIVDGGNFLDEPVIRTHISNFDNDRDLEMAAITRNEFIMFDLGELPVNPSSQLPWKPEQYAITAAYPNPFNNSTRIEYQVAQPGQISLSLFDLTGKEVTRLFKGWKQAGVYNQMLNGVGLPSGNYVLTLNANNMKVTKSIQLLK
ncbi:MAG: T9SS type A sorting domain-containing protein [Candidatus Hatepunaea meridiana]|nr:T9SS type A sorting domain-containing protein [Candidatus Hatepunaea meridiana]